jgi:pyruvate/2-oxoacid:ferredoxin oxidoreductase beta subunit
MRVLKRSLVGLIGLFAASAAVAQEMNWVKVTSYLTGRGGHAMAYDAARGQVVLFGGLGSSGRLNDTWVWDGTNWVQKFPGNAPPARYGHAMAYDAARGAGGAVWGRRQVRTFERHLGMGRDELGAEVSRQCPAGPLSPRDGL